MSISGEAADLSPAAPEPKHKPPLLTLTSIVKGATSVCKEKERKGKGFGHVFPCLSSGFDPFWALIQKLIRRKVQPSITLKEKKKMAHPSEERQTVSDMGC